MSKLFKSVWELCGVASRLNFIWKCIIFVIASIPATIIAYFGHVLKSRLLIIALLILIIYTILLILSAIIIPKIWKVKVEEKSIRNKILEKMKEKRKQQEVLLEVLSPIDDVKKDLEEKKIKGKQLRDQSWDTPRFFSHSKIMNWKDYVAKGIAEAFGVDSKKEFLEKLPQTLEAFIFDSDNNQEDLRRFLDVAIKHIDWLIENKVTQDLVQGFVPSSLKRYEGNDP